MFWVVFSHLTLLSMWVRREGFTGIYYLGKEKELFDGKRLETETKLALFSWLCFSSGLWLDFEEGTLGERERRDQENIVVLEEFVVCLAFWLCPHMKFQELET